MEQIEFETSFGLVVASEQALVDALLEVLERERAGVGPEPASHDGLSIATG